MYGLKESHRTRTVFRKVGGFLYVMGLLDHLEETLSDCPPSEWSIDIKEPPRCLLSLLLTIFNTLTTAMRYEPANAIFFQEEVNILFI